MPIQLFLIVFSFWLIICTSCQKQSPELSVTSEDKTVKKEKLPIYQKQNNLNVREPKASENDKLILTDQEWREKLTTQEYLILRQKGPERPFSNEMKKIYIFVSWRTDSPPLTLRNYSIPYLVIELIVKNFFLPFKHLI